MYIIISNTNILYILAICTYWVRELRYIWGVSPQNERECKWFLMPEILRGNAAVDIKANNRLLNYTLFFIIIPVSVIV